MSDTHLVVALEGGGSKTVALAVDASGRVIAWGRGGSSLALYVGDERAGAAVVDAIDGVAAAIDPDAVAVVTGAMVGRGYAADPWQAVQERFPKARFDSLPEGDAALIGATLETAGAVALSGTGAFGRAVGRAGHAGHVGGNGPLVGDEGSGHWIAVEAVRRALWSRDGRGPATRLRDAICRHFDLERLGWIIGRLYGPRAMGRHEIASLAPVVVEVSREGDEVAREILGHAAQLLADQVAAAIRHVWEHGDGWDGAIPFGCSGGVLLGSPELRALTAGRLAASVPEIELREPRVPPVGGVAIQALRSAGVTVDEPVIRALADSLPPEVGAVRPAPVAGSPTR